jgi:hypothetical protein
MTLIVGTASWGPSGVDLGRAWCRRIGPHCRHRLALDHPHVDAWVVRRDPPGRLLGCLQRQVPDLGRRPVDRMTIQKFAREGSQARGGV